MDVLQVRGAKALWLFQTADLNPKGKDMTPLFSALVKRYRFTTVPDFHAAIKANEGVKLESGVFASDPEGDVEVNVSIFADGLVAETRTDTEVSEEFLEDMSVWSTDEFGLTPPNLIMKTYVSELVVHFGDSLVLLNKKLESLANLISSKIQGPNRPRFDVSGFQLGPTTGANLPGMFRFEREVGIPYEQGRFYSAAPLTTAEHVDLLQQLEAILNE